MRDVFPAAYNLNKKNRKLFYFICFTVSYRVEQIFHLKHLPENMIVFTTAFTVAYNNLNNT